MSANSSNTAIDKALDGEAPANPYFSLHTADPGTTGANELPSGTYARMAGTFGAAASKSKAAQQVVFNVPAGESITHWGMWDAASGGTWYDGGLLPAPESYGSAGTYGLTVTLKGS